MIDWSKPIETTDGRKARILASDVRFKNNILGKSYPLVIAVEESIYLENLYRCRDDGTSFGGYVKIRNIPLRKELYARIYGDKSIGGNFKDLATARARSAVVPREYLAIIKTTLEDGVPVSVELLPPSA